MVAGEIDVEKASDSERDAKTVEVFDFAPIRTARSRGSLRLSSSARQSLSRPRSNNGWGVDDSGEDEETTAEEEGDHRAAGSEPEGVARPEKDPFEVGWDGGDADPLNPRSFALWRKWMIVLIVSAGSLCVTAASSIYTSTYEQMDAEFGNSKLVATLGLSTFVMGIALGPMLLSPLSEFYGRRPIYLVSWANFVIWIIPSAVAKNIATMIVVRFFDGLAGSAFLSVAGGTVGDMFPRSELQAPMMAFSMAPFIGPSIGPLIGGFINYYVDWRWTFWVLLIWAVLLMVAIAVLVPETFHPALLRVKARRMRKETGDERYMAPMEKRKKSLAKTLGLSLLRPFQLLVYEPMCLNLCIYSAILLGILYLFFGAFPLVFTTNHDFNLWQVGLSFMGIFCGMVVSGASDPLWHRIRDRLIARLEARTGVEGASEPEFRLPPAILGSVLVTVGMFWFAWTTYPSVHWILPIIGSAIFGAGTLLTFTGIFTFLVDAYPLYAASALAANAFVRCSFAAAFPLFGVQMYEKLGFQWATTLLAFLTLVMLPFPYIFFKYGKKIRGKSRFATD